MTGTGGMLLPHNEPQRKYRVGNSRLTATNSNYLAVAYG